MNARFKALCDELDATRDGEPIRYFRMQFALVRTERLTYPARTIIYLGPGKLPSFFDGIRFERAKEPDSFGFHTETFNWNSPDAFTVNGDTLSIVSARFRAEHAGWRVETRVQDTGRKVKCRFQILGFVEGHWLEIGDGPSATRAFALGLKTEEFLAPPVPVVLGPVDLPGQ